MTLTSWSLVSWPPLVKLCASCSKSTEVEGPRTTFPPVWAFINSSSNSCVDRITFEITQRRTEYPDANKPPTVVKQNPFCPSSAYLVRLVRHGISSPAKFHQMRARLWKWKGLFDQKVVTEDTGGIPELHIGVRHVLGDGGWNGKWHLRTCRVSERDRGQRSSRHRVTSQTFPL